MTRLAIQLFTFKNRDESLVETLEYLADTPFEGVEFAGFKGSTVEEVGASLDETGLEPVGAHVRADAIEDDYEGTIETYRGLGVDRLVVPTYDTAAFETADGVEDAAAHLAGLADRLEDDGFELHYHNHRFEFTDLGDRTAFDLFVDRVDGRVGLEIDTGLATNGGDNPVDLLERYGDFVSLVHLTDTIPGSDDSLHADLETGVVDVEACVRTATSVDADWVVFEHGRTTDARASAENAAAVLQPVLDE